LMQQCGNFIRRQRMLQQERTKLLFGPYRVPKCRVGGSLVCRMRGKVRVTGIMDAPMQWPYTPRSRKCPRPSVIVCGDLVRALRRESATAIAYWWGVSICTVWRWRISLGVEQFTEGTRDLCRRWLPEKLDEEALQNQKKALRSPECMAKRAASLRGKPMPAKVKRALLKANRGRKHSAEACRNMSEAQKRRPPHENAWVPDEIALLGTMRDSEIAKRTGRTIPAVRSRRRLLGIANFFKRKPRSQAPRWTPNMDKLMGTMPDPVLAQKLKTSHAIIVNRRRKLKVPPFRLGG
jgi:hypothetical protein